MTRSPSRIELPNLATPHERRIAQLDNFPSLPDGFLQNACRNHFFLVVVAHLGAVAVFPPNTPLPPPKKKRDDDAASQRQGCDHASREHGHRSRINDLAIVRGRRPLHVPKTEATSTTATKRRQLRARKTPPCGLAVVDPCEYDENGPDKWPRTQQERHDGQDVKVCAPPVAFPRSLRQRRGPRRDLGNRCALPSWRPRKHAENQRQLKHRDHVRSCDPSVEATQFFLRPVSGALRPLPPRPVASGKILHG